MISNDKYIPNLLHVILPLVLPDILDNSHKRSKEFKLIEIFRNYLENQIPRTKLKSHQFDQIEIPFRYREKKKSKKNNVLWDRWETKKKKEQLTQITFCYKIITKYREWSTGSMR